MRFALVTVFCLLVAASASAGEEVQAPSLKGAVQKKSLQKNALQGGPSQKGMKPLQKPHQKVHAPTQKPLQKNGVDAAHVDAAQGGASAELVEELVPPPAIQPSVAAAPLPPVVPAEEALTEEALTEEALTEEAPAEEAPAEEAPAEEAPAP